LEVANEQLIQTSGDLEKALDQVRAERAKARRYLYTARMALAQRADQENDSARVVALLRSVIPEAADQEDLREFEWHHLWRKHHGEESRISGNGVKITAVGYTPDARRLVAGGEDGSIVVRDAITGKIERKITASGGITALGIAPDNRLLIAASDDGQLKIWDLQTGEQVRSLNCPDLGTILVLLCDEHSSQVAALTDRGIPLRWHLPSGEFLPEADQSWRAFTQAYANALIPPLRPAYRTLSCFAWSANGDRMVSAQSTVARNTVTAKVQYLGRDDDGAVAQREFKSVITQVACSHDGSIVAAAGSDMTVRVWDISTGSDIRTLQIESEVTVLHFSPDGSRLLAGFEDGALLVWSLPQKAERTIAEDQGQINNVTFGAKGRLATAGLQGAKVWDVVTGRELASFAGARDSRVALSPHNGWLVGTKIGGLRDPVTMRLIAEVPGGTTFHGYGFAFSRDEALVARASSGDITVYSTQSGIAVFTQPMAKWGSSAAFSPDNRLLAAGSGTMDIYAPGQLKVCELATGKTLFSDDSLRLGVWWLEFSPDGKLLAAALGNYADRGANVGRVAIWETATWKKVLELRGHSGCVWSVAFSPSGNRLASAASHFGRTSRLPIRAAVSELPPHNEGEVIIWDVATGHEVMRLRDYDSGFFGVAFSPDNRWLATGSKSGIVKLLDGAPLLQSPAYAPLAESP
jgi:WD40 repeat protein